MFLYLITIDNHAVVSFMEKGQDFHIVKLHSRDFVKKFWVIV